MVTGPSVRDNAEQVSGWCQPLGLWPSWARHQVCSGLEGSGRAGEAGTWAGGNGV